jgi:hypothetical protein
MGRRHHLVRLGARLSNTSGQHRDREDRRAFVNKLTNSRGRMNSSSTVVLSGAKDLTLAKSRRGGR